MLKTSMLKTSALTTSMLKASALTTLVFEEGEAGRNAERGSGWLFVLIGRAAGQRETADWLEQGAVGGTRRMLLPS